MKSVTLNVNGIKFNNEFTTVVSRVISPDSDSFIVLDSLPNIQISLAGETATSLGIEKNTQVTVKPISGATDGSFNLEVGEKVVAKKSPTQSTRGSSPARTMTLSNDLD